MIVNISNIIFFILFSFSIYLFIKNILKIFQKISLGKDYKINKNSKKQRLLLVLKVAFGQSKMKTKPISAIFHLFIYLGFIVINLKLIEIIIDGLFYTHRIIGKNINVTFYNVITSTTEIFALLVIISIIFFFIRRNFLGYKKFNKEDIKNWARLDGNIILFFEFLLMVSFLLMEGADYQIMALDNHIIGNFPLSKHFVFLDDLSVDNLNFIERFCWWFHIIGIFIFMNYLYYSKHLHIILAFPNVYYSQLENIATMDNMTSVSKELKSMLGIDLNKDEKNIKNDNFGAKDIFDLNKKQLFNAYTCTECGRCTDVCPANITGKKLSPRKIMMATRDRMEEIKLDKKGKFIDDKKTLLDYISNEEIWACTTCMACVQTCPLNIDPLSIILDLRRYLSMEEAKIPNLINKVNNSLELNSNPWNISTERNINKL